MKAIRAVLWVAFGLFFLFPLYAMADFSTRDLVAGGRTLQAWRNLVADEALYQAIVVSLLLAVFTVVAMLAILVPTMIWVRLRAPWARGLVEYRDGHSGRAQPACECQPGWPGAHHDHRRHGGSRSVSH